MSSGVFHTALLIIEATYERLARAQVLPVIITTVLPIVISAAAFLFSGITFWESRKRALAAARFNQTMTLLDEWRKDLLPYRRHFDLISDTLAYDQSSWQLGYGRQSPEDRTAIERISHFFDHIGWLFLTKNVDERLLLTSIGPPIMRYWGALQHCLDYEREIRGQEKKGKSKTKNEPKTIGGEPPGLYQAGFEHLAQVTHERYRKYYIKPKKADFNVPGYPDRQLR